MQTHASELLGPRQIILVRHGEKDIPENSPDLNARGFARAAALPSFFTRNSEVLAFGPIASIYAMKPKDEDGSRRPIQTVTPTAKVLGLPIHADLTKKMVTELVNAVIHDPEAQGKTVLICWEHKMIPIITEAFGATSAPKDWDGSIYDRAWILRTTANGTIEFLNVAEHVLPGDSN